MFQQKPISEAWNFVIGVLLIIRAFTSSLIAGAVFLPLYLAGAGIEDSLYASIPFFCAAAGGFTLNDYYDLSKDQINKPYRAIPSGRLKPNVALSFGFILIVVAFVASFLVYRNRFQLLLFLISIGGVTFYGLVTKYFSLSKTILTAAVSVLPIVYVTERLSYPRTYLLIPIGGLFFLLGRELLMDIRDIAGDSSSRMKTLPTVIGSSGTAKIAFTLLGLCGLILIFFTAQVWSIRNVILTSIILSSSFVVPYGWSYRKGKYRRSVIISLYIPMLCGILLLMR